ncbi:hypothetical protein F4556_006329 [Kitasatospora gansuensis]|uniref:AAA ATPase-like protein n=1 Tax=Kitasatospora gansuensis TaxID=258050 RepID=A0A7W7SHW9_9ACTN|nr:AAA family ATPase [Kitasatospora gansuensis]MBB4950794.1 hypothetical protein [Kitasatospora gansuensis]
MADSASQRQHIDRAEQLSRAARLASGEETGQRALFFEGPEGIGKSSLLFEIHDRHRENGAYFVDLERTVREYDVLETLAIQARGQRVETPSYRTARDRFAEQAGSLNVEFTNVRARASAFQIIGQTEDRILRTAALSDALLDNLLADDRRPVFCLDGFERCGQPMRKWLGDSLLPNLLSRKDAGVFLAGREVPRLTHPDSTSVHTMVLPPFDVEAVQEWIEALGVTELHAKSLAIHQEYGGIPMLLDEFFTGHLAFGRAGLPRQQGVDRRGAQRP